MISADTNLLLRHLVADDPVQTECVFKLFGEAEASGAEVFISHIVLCELCWVLEAAYDFKKSAMLKALETLLEDRLFVMQERAVVEDALADYRLHPGQFAGHLIGAVAAHHECSTTYTFDKALAKSSLFTLLK